MNALTGHAFPHAALGLLAQQHALLDAIWSGRPSASEACNAANSIAACAFNERDRGLKAYQSNGHALAERVLAAAYPVVTEVISADSMGQLARALWHAHPPTRGDLAWWGGDLPTFIQASPQLADLPWLADLARLEWALHTVQLAPDRAPDPWLGEPVGPESLSLLATDDPAHLTLSLAAGTGVLALDCDVWPIWDAHVRQAHTGSQARLSALRALGPDAAAWALRQTPATQVLLWRPVHEVHCQPVPAATADFVQALLEGCSLLAALERADPGLATWLPQAIRQGLVQGACPLPCPSSFPPTCGSVS